jgi:hypothetical protein
MQDDVGLCSMFTCLIHLKISEPLTISSYGCSMSANDKDEIAIFVN